MQRKLLFLGNNGSLLEEIIALRFIKVIGVVADRVSGLEQKYFGSSFTIGKKLGIPIVSQKDFKKNCKKYMKTIFKEAEVIFIHGYHYKADRDLRENKAIKIVNFHQSLLPKYAGRHPLNWAIINGEKNTGITFHYINAGFDSGDIILQRKVAISRKDNINTLYNKTIAIANKNLGRVFKSVFDVSFKPRRQNLKERTYFPPRSPKDGRISEDESTAQIRNKIRALLLPYPGAHFYFNKKKMVINSIKEIKDSEKISGIKFITRNNRGIFIRAKDGILRVTSIRLTRES